MLNKMKKLFLLVAVALLALVVVGCGNGGLEDWADSLKVPTEVSGDFGLTSKVGDATVEWKSDNTSIISILNNKTALVTLPGEDVTVTLTAKLSYGEQTTERTFTVKVLASTIVPTSIKINTDGVPSDGSRLVLPIKGTGFLMIETDPIGANAAVTWELSNENITIATDGTITGVLPGPCKITAKSIKDPSVTDSVTITVVKSDESRQILIDEMNKIKGKLPEFVIKDFYLPIPEQGVEVEYTLEDGSVLEQNRYIYDYNEAVGDVKVPVTCKLSLDGDELVETLTLLVVDDPDVNDFTALTFIDNYFKDQFADYLSGNDKLKGDVTFKTEFTAEEAGKEAKVTWGTSAVVGTNPLTSEGKYTKPLDDTQIVLSATTEVGNNKQTFRYTFMVAGFTKEEIVQYVTENVLPQKAASGNYELEGANINLPTKDTTRKFGKLAIEWSSSDENTLSSKGQIDVNLSGNKNVTLTAKIKYAGTVSEEYAFEQDVPLDFTVKPCANDAQRLSLTIVNKFAEEGELLSKIAWFPYGAIGREGGNKLPLPMTVGDVLGSSNADAAVALTWTFEQDMFDAEGNLLKQFLRYRDTTLTFALTKGSDTATNEITINVGIAQLETTFYLGGFFSTDQTDGASGDALSQLSKFDDSTPTNTERGKTWGGKPGAGSPWSGVTVYVDVTDDAGNVTRHQLFIGEQTIANIEATDIHDVTVKDKQYTDVAYASTHIQGQLVSGDGGNWGIFFHNTLDKPVKVPMAPLAGSPMEGTMIADAALAIDSGRENAFTFDGWRAAWVCDADGKVVLGNGDQVIQYVLNDYYIEIPAGGYGMTFKTQMNKASVTKEFCTKGAKLTFETFTPWHKVEGNDASGLQSYVH